MNAPTPVPAATAASPAASPLPWLLADIGGTHARFGWIGESGSEIQWAATLPCADHAGPAAAARAYLADVARQAGNGYRAPRAAALAVATTVAGDRIELTNSGWAFSRQDLARELKLEQLKILNDFEALALALPRLSPAQCRPIGTTRPLTQAQAAQAGLAVVGPGTGLGVAGLVPTDQGWVAVPSEGGHVSLAPADDFESALLGAVRREHRHVSAERLLSGIGLPVLHTGVAAVLGQKAPQLSAREIVQRGLSGGDPLCQRTIDLFCSLLGGFAGNVALTLGSRGGLFIGGGIVPRLGQRFFDSSFRQRFEAKGRFEAYLRAIPTALITDTRAALSGAAVALERPGR